MISFRPNLLRCAGLVKVLFLCICISQTGSSGRCPKSYVTEVCQNNARLRMAVSFTLDKNAKCERSIRTLILPDLICPARNRIKSSACDNGQVSELYEAYELVKCKCEKVLKSFQKPCPCKPCETLKGECDLKIKSINITTTCFHRTEGVQCKPDVQTTYEACDKCEGVMTQKVEPCDYCRGNRQVIVSTRFREDAGRHRCLEAKRVTLEPCGCKQGVWSMKHCENRDTIMRNLLHRSQISCSICQTKRFRIVDQKIHCRGRVVVRQPCQRDPSTGFAYQAINLINEYPEDCVCKRTLHTVKRLCGCPLGVKHESTCFANTNTIFTKVASFHLIRDANGGSYCQPQIHIERSHPTICPPANQTEAVVINESQYECDQRTCERTTLKPEWRMERCQCQRIVQRRPAGLCCCPKPETKVSACINHLHTVRHVSYELFNGQCQRHLASSMEPCGELSQSNSFNCDKETGLKTYKVVQWENLPYGGNVETIQIRRIPTLCHGAEIVSVSRCEKRGDRHFRNILMITRPRDGCECTAPQSSVILEACRCEDIDTGRLVEVGAEFKLEQGCQSECSAESEKCGTPACQHIVRWYKMAYLDDNENFNGTHVEASKCQRRLVKQEVTNCCCPKTADVTRKCEASGKKWEVRQTSYVLQSGLCMQSVRDWQEPVNCSNGFVGRELAEKRPDGMQEVRLIYEATEDCRCERYLQRVECPWRCPEPEARIYCDEAFKETVEETVKYALIGCKCQRQVQKTRRKAVCPNYSEVISRKCSNESRLETIVTKKIIQEGCECKVRQEVTTEKCACPPEIHGPFRCNPNSNQMEQIVVKSILLAGKCQTIQDVIKKPIECSDKANIENATYINKVVCNTKTGMGRITRPLWSIKNCKCARELQVLREGPCKCQPTKVLTQCDAVRNVKIYKKVSYLLDKLTLHCSVHVSSKEEVIKCPNVEIQNGACNFTSGRQLVKRFTFKIDNCACRRDEFITFESCGCASSEPVKGLPKCDLLRSERVLQISKMRWRNDLQDCVHFIKTLHFPIVCKPHVQFMASSCQDGKSTVKIITRFLDVNSCQCIGKVTVKKVDCRCPPKRVLIGNCADEETTQIAVVLDRSWAPKKRQCVVVNRYQSRLFCSCPTAKEESVCRSGQQEITRTKYELYGGRYGCMKMEEVERWTPKCSVDDLREQRNPCDSNTCKRETELYSRAYDPATCQCVWSLKSREQCSCCGCPQSKVDYSCLNNTELIAKVSYFVTKEMGCGHSCEKMTKFSRKPIHCKEPAKLDKPHWAACDRSTCVQNLIGYLPSTVNCQCKLIKHVLASRKCCCAVTPQETVSCHDGSLVTVIKSQELINFSCKMKIEYIAKENKCDQETERKLETCDPLSCKRSVYELSWIRDRHTCECQPHQRLIATEDCCCLPSLPPKQICIGFCNVLIKIQTNFDAKQRSCIKTQHIFRNCPTCPMPFEEAGECDRSGSCLQTVKVINYKVQDCQCRQEITVKTRNCCCPNPPQEPPKCLEEDHILISNRITFDLVHGVCVKRTRQISVPLVCPPKSGIEALQAKVERGVCEPNTCQRKVYAVSWHVVGCQCIQQKHETLEPCCCNQHPRRVKQLCQSDGSLIKEIRNWKVVDGNCLPEMVTEHEPTVKCTPLHMHPIGPCNPKTGRQPIEINKYQLDHCHCRLVWTGAKDRLCSCPEDERKESGCNPSTCQQELKRWHYVAVNGSCQRLPPTRSSVQCCCRPGEVKTGIQRSCEPQTGVVSEVQTVERFDHMTKKCLPFTLKRSIQPTACDKEQQIKYGVCNPISGTKIDIVTFRQFDRATCSCQTREILKQSICNCNHLPRLPVETKCDAVTNNIVTIAKTFRLENGTCVKSSDASRRETNCPKPEVMELKCNATTCMAVVETVEFVAENCVCVKRMKTSKARCCCPREQFTQHCLEGGKLSVQRHLKFTFDRETRTCEKSSHVERREIKCSTEEVIELRRTCNQTTCHPTSLQRRNVLRDCKCQTIEMTVVLTKKACCCPPPQMALKCFNDSGILQGIKYQYELVGEKCMTGKSITQEKIVCFEDQVVSGTCDPVTKRRSITSVSYSIANCKCVKKVQHTTAVCGCPPMKIDKSPCSPGKNLRNISKISFSEVLDGQLAKCVRKVEVLHTERCYCPEPVVERKCIGGQYQQHTTVFRLLERDGRMNCAREDKITNQSIICPIIEKPKVLASECVKNLRTITILHQFVDPTTCNCQIRREVRQEACDCRSRNTQKQTCKDNVLSIFSEEYSSQPGDQHCTLHSSEKLQPIVCARNEQIVNSGAGCVEQREHGIYRADVVRWQERKSCACVSRERINYRLCTCQKPEEVKRCEGNSMFFVESLQFTQVNNQCLPSRQMINKEIRCEEAARVINVSNCQKTNSSCLETVSVEEHLVKECKCVKNIRTFQRLCCAPSPRIARTCVNQTGQWVTTVDKFTLIDARVLYKQGSLEVRDRRVSSTRDVTTEQIVCPDKDITEHCDKSTGVWTRTTTSHQRQGCLCKTAKKIATGQCVCPEPEEWTSPCEQNFHQIRTKYYRMVDGKCLRFTKSTRQRCACPQPIRRVYCDGMGRWVKCYTEFQLDAVAHICKIAKHCVRWSPACPATKRAIVKAVCSPSNGYQQMVKTVSYQLDQSTCLCRGHSSNVWQEYCRCDQLNNQSLSCDKGIRTRKSLQYELSDGRCIAKESVNQEKIVCEAPKFQFTECQLDPNSPSRGTRVKIIQEHINDGCECVAKTRNVTETCDCQLRFGEAERVNCVGLGELEITKTHWFLREGKCESQSEVKRQNINCAKPKSAAKLQKTITSECNYETDGIGRRRITSFEPRPKGCRCVAIPVKSYSEICSCPSAKVKKVCLEGGQILVERKITYKLSIIDEKQACNEQVSETRLNPCGNLNQSETVREKAGECDQSICRRTIEVFIKVTEACQCITKRSIRTEVCCCQKDTKPVVKCIQPEHRLVKVYKSFHLTSMLSIGGKNRSVETFCDTRSHLLSSIVTCAENKPRVMATKCNTTHRLIRISVKKPVGCGCVTSVIQTVKIRCGCPKDVKVVRGACKGALAEDKWVSLQAVPFLKTVAGVKVPSLHCRPVVLRQAKRRCACPVYQSLRQCLPGNKLRIIHTNFTYNSQRADCERHTLERTHPTTCPKSHRRISECGGLETAYTAVETLTNWTAIDCVCIPKTYQQPFICNCEAKFPTQVHTTCQMNAFLQTSTINSVLKNHKCIPTISKSISRLVCAREPKSIKAPCDAGSQRRSINWLKQVPVNCKCEWKPMLDQEIAQKRLKTSEACFCSKPTLHRKCHKIGNNGVQLLEMTTTHYHLFDGECHPEPKIVQRNITCQTGTHIQRSKCDQLTREVVEIQAKISLENCECKTVTTRRHCQCSCPQPKTRAVCNQNTGNLRLIRESSQLDADKCACITSSHLIDKKIDCPEDMVFDRVVSACQPDDSGDKIRKITWTTVTREGCKCVKKQHREILKCECNASSQMVTKCVNNEMQEVFTTKRVLINERECIRKVVNKQIQQINCPDAKTTQVCDNLTGIALVTKLQPVVENCVCNNRVQTYKIRCKCNSQKRLIRTTACGADCKITYIHQHERLTPEGTCLPETVANVKRCCCPATQSLKDKCDIESGMTSRTQRSFSLVEGDCLHKDTVISAPTVCLTNETSRVIKEPTGYLRFEKTKNVRVGCTCQSQKKISFKKWKCPKASRSKICVQNSAGQFTWKTSVTMWKSSVIQPICSRREVFTNWKIIVCPSSPQNVSNCIFNSKRHAFVRSVITYPTRIEGCRCIPEKPVINFQVCKCAPPSKKTVCSKKEGIIIHSTVQYNTSTDGGRCVPRETRRQWKKVCARPAPVFKMTTKCEGAQFFKIYEEHIRDGCKCIPKITKLPFPCSCPPSDVQTKCINGNSQIQTSTTYTKLPNGSCQREQQSTIMRKDCQFPPDLLASGQNFTLRHVNSTTIAHIYACGSGGSVCMRRLVTLSISAVGCGECKVQRMESREACCCHEATSKLSGRRDCSSPQALLERRQKRFTLKSGVCWPTVLTHIEPLVCSNHEYLRPVGICENGRQRFIRTTAIQKNCQCKADQSLVWRPCLCQTVASAEVVFLVDESVSSRADGYSIRVRELLKHIVTTFKSSRNTSNYRFAVVKYANNPSIAFNLGEYEDKNPMLQHLDNLNYEGRLSNLERALDLTKREVLSKSREGIVRMIYIISDGVNDQSARVDLLANELKAAGVQMHALALGADKRGQTFLDKLASQPRQQHFVIFKSRDSMESLSNWLVRTLCIKACPSNTVTRSVCSRDTACVGHIYERVYQFNSQLARCVGVSRKKTYNCCCLQSPTMEKMCRKGRQILTQSMWQLRPNKIGVSVCHHFKLERDITGTLKEECSPSEEVQMGQCGSDGMRTDLVILKSLENCECKVILHRDIKRCLCDANLRTTQQCIGGNLLTKTTKKEVLVGGRCVEHSSVLQDSVICKDQHIFAAKCDPLTCQRRLIFVSERPENCACKKQMRIVYETCCCPLQLADKTKLLNRETCIHGNTRVISTETVSYEKSVKTCVKTIDKVYESIDCPTHPSITRSPCRPVDPSEFPDTDLNLLYRRVEIQSWTMHHCECRRSRQWEFELCGCREQKNPMTQECHAQQGVQVAYKQEFILVLLSGNQTVMDGNAVGKRVGSLSQAKCRLTFSGQAVKRTFCPDSNKVIGPCIYGDGENNRAYRRIETQTWVREGCSCKQRSPQVTRKLCGCRKNVWFQQQCSANPRDKQALLYINRIKERLVEVGGANNLSTICRVEMKQLPKKIECPPPRIHYTNCVVGKLIVTVELIAAKNCKCKHFKHKRELRCMQYNADGKPIDQSLGEGVISSLENAETSKYTGANLKKRLEQFGLPDIHGWSNDNLKSISNKERNSEPFPLEQFPNQEASRNTPKSKLENFPRDISQGPIQEKRPSAKVHTVGKHISRSKLQPPSINEAIKRGFQLLNDQGNTLSGTPAEGAGRSKIHEVHSPTTSMQTPNSRRKQKRPRLVLFELPRVHDALPTRSMSPPKINSPPRLVNILAHPSTRYPKISLPPKLSDVLRAQSAGLAKQFFDVRMKPTLPPMYGRPPTHQQMERPTVLNVIECLDLLPSERCAQLEQRPHLECDKPGQIRDQLCRKTCQVCQDYPIHQTDFKLIQNLFNNNSNPCMGCDEKFGGIYILGILRQTGFIICKETCSANPECRSFDFYVPKDGEKAQKMNAAVGTCVMNRVDLQTLRKRRGLSLEEVAGVSKEALEKLNAKRCLLFNKINLEKCSEPSIEYTGECVCELLRSENPLATGRLTGSEPENGRLHCTRSAHSVSFEHDSEGRCKEMIRKVNFVCQAPQKSSTATPNIHENISTVEKTPQNSSQCFDVQSTAWCEEQARSGACRKVSFVKICAGTCGRCVCKRGNTYSGKCQPNGKMLVQRVHYTYHPEHGRCVANKDIQVVVCDSCPTTSFEVVQKCDRKTHQRKIIQVTPVTLRSRQHPGTSPLQCHMKLKKREVDCKGCVFSNGEGMDRKSVSGCVQLSNGHYRLAVKTEYMIQEAGCCKLISSYRSYPCKGCPKMHSRTTKCSENNRLRSTVFYTRPSTGKFKDETKSIPVAQCLRHVVVRKEPCIQLSNEKESCKDLLGLVECEEFKHTGLCKINHETARLLCPRMCEFC